MSMTKISIKIVYPKMIVLGRRMGTDANGKGEMQILSMTINIFHSLIIAQKMCIEFGFFN